MTAPPNMLRTGCTFVPVSFQQEGIWIATRFDDTANASYNMVFAFELSGQLNEDIFCASIHDLVKRHDALRLYFLEHDGLPVQVLHALVGSNPVIRDYGCPANISEIATSLRRTPLDLSAQTPFHVRLFRTRDRTFGIVFRFHHIAFDGWSAHNFFRELAETYNARLGGRQPRLPELDISYLDYARSQRCSWDVGEESIGLQFWTNALRGIPTRVYLPTRMGNIARSYAARTTTFHVCSDTFSAIKAVAATEHATPFMVFLAVFEVLIARYSGEIDFGVRIPVANRGEENLEPVIGMFVNTLVIRSDVCSKNAFRELLRDVRRRFVQAMEHQSTPFSEIVRKLGITDESGREPLSQLALNFMLDCDYKLELDGLSAAIVPTTTPFTHNDLLLEIRLQVDGSVQGTFTYCAELFESAVIERMAGHYQRLLNGAVSGTDTQISLLPLLSDLERHEILFEWNRTHADVLYDRCIHGLFETQVERNSSCVAVVDEWETVTYSELNSRANVLARYLQSLGIGRNVFVAVCLAPSCQLIVALLGVMKAGGAYLPLDVGYPSERLTYMLSDSAAPVLVTQESLLPKLHARPGKVICLDKDWDVIKQSAITNADHRCDVDSFAYCIYTSGSTGKPKGVAVSHRNLIASTEARKHVYGSPDALLVSPVSFDSSAAVIWGTLLTGARLVVPPAAETKDPERLLDVIQRHGPLHLLCVPSLYWMLLDLESTAIEKLSAVTVCGEECRWDLAERHFERLPMTPLFNEYGPTETTIWASVFTMPSVESIRNRSRIPIGRPIANTQIYILDDHLTPVPVGVRGEIYIAGEGVTCGYLNDPELTSRKFLPNPFVATPGGRMFKTGDMGCYDVDGIIEFLGREDRQVKIRGFRLELGEVEAAVRRLRNIQDVAVIARKSSPGGTRVIACIVSKDSKSFAFDAIRQELAEYLPDFMIPTGFVLLDALPRTPNGKVNFEALLSMQAAGSPTDSGYVAPRSAIEQAISDIWAEVLKVDRVGLHDNFFALGGHSLLATQVISKMRKSLGAKVPLRDFFACPSVFHLARLVTPPI